MGLVSAEERIRAADPSDLPALSRLLQESSLPVAGLPPRLTHFLIAETGDGVIAAAGLEVYGRAALLRSVVVHNRYRGTGVGRRIVTRILDLSDRLGVEDVFLLTTTASEWFPRFGFAPAEPAEVPDPMRQSAEFRGACPASAVLMRRGRQVENSRRQPRGVEGNQG